MNWYFEKLAQKPFKQMRVSCTLEEGLIKKFHFIKAEQCFFKQAFSSQDYNLLITYDKVIRSRFIRRDLPLIGDSFFLTYL